MRSYEAARSLFSFLGFCAWSVIVLGGLVAMVAGGAVSNGFGGSPSGLQVMLAAIPGLTLALIGFLMLAQVQVGRTSVDTAEYSQQTLDVSRKQLEVSKQALELNRSRAASYEGRMPVTASSEAVNEAGSAASYSNEPASDMGATKQASEPPAKNEIVYKDGKYFVGVNSFLSRVDAARYLKQQAKGEPLRAIR